MWTREGIRIKYLPQEPDLDSSLNVMENIRRGIAEQVEFETGLGGRGTRRFGSRRVAVCVYHCLPY